MQAKTKFRAAALATVALGAAALPAASQAATVQVSNGTLLYQAAAGERNQLSIDIKNGFFHVTDGVAPLFTGTGCTTVNFREVNCNGVSRIDLQLGDNNDSTDLIPENGSRITVPVTIDGGAGDDFLVGSVGNDRISASSGNDVLHGVDGNDTLAASTGNDALFGGPGSDMLSGGTGKDEVHGGTEVDTITYKGRTTAVNVTLGDGLFNDGGSGEQDFTDGDIENVLGTEASDVIVGDSLANRITGFGGNDTITGGLGVDIIDAGEGNDRVKMKDNTADGLINCGNGTDTLERDTFDSQTSSC
jgi:Ca2+-binding RTX toxin-like protein